MIYRWIVISFLSLLLYLGNCQKPALASVSVFTTDFRHNPSIILIAETDCNDCTYCDGCEGESCAECSDCYTCNQSEDCSDCEDCYGCQGDECAECVECESCSNDLTSSDKTSSGQRKFLGNNYRGSLTVQ